jgi:hypothetical protein
LLQPVRLGVIAEAAVAKNETEAMVAHYRRDADKRQRRGGDRQAGDRRA